MSISLFRAIAGQYDHLRQVNSVPLMNTISHLLEDQVVEHALPIDFYAGFQRFSNFPHQLRRYQRLALVCRRVYVFGVADVQPPAISGVEFVRLDPSSPLAREWFVLIDSPELWAALLTQEVPGRDRETGGRRFDGIWTYDPTPIERASLLISQQLGRVYQPVLSRSFERQSLHVAQIGERLLARYGEARQIERRRWNQLAAVQHVAEAIARPRMRQDPESRVELARAIVEIVHLVFGAPEAAIALSEPEGSVAIVDRSGELRRGRLELGRGLSPSDLAFARAEPVSLADAQQSGQVDLLLQQAVSVAAVPLAGQRQVYGVLTVGAPTPAAWSEEDVRSLRVVAAMLALALEQPVMMDEALRARTRRVEQVLTALRPALVRLHTLQQRARALSRQSVPLGPEQRQQLEQALDQGRELSARLVQALGIAQPDLFPEEKGRERAVEG